MRRTFASEASRWGPPPSDGLIFVLSAQPHLRFSDDGGLDFVVRKLGHAGAYAILALLVFRARGASMRRAALAALLVAVTYAVGDELHQGFVAGRSPSALDVAIDAAGAPRAPWSGCAWRRGFGCAADRWRGG